jgi:hypothetical protein
MASSAGSQCRSADNKEALSISTDTLAETATTTNRKVIAANLRHKSESGQCPAYKPCAKSPSGAGLSRLGSNSSATDWQALKPRVAKRPKLKAVHEEQYQPFR